MGNFTPVHMQAYTTPVNTESCRSGWLFACCFVLLLPLQGVARMRNLGAEVEKAFAAHRQKKFDSALIFADQAFLLARHQGDTLYMLRAMRGKGKALLALKKEKESAETYFAALRMCSGVKYERELGLLYGEIGYNYYVQGNGREAKEYYRRNIDILSRVTGADSVGNPLINLAVTHQMLGEFDSARLVLQRVQAIVARNNDSSMKAYCLLNLGAYYTQMGKADSARLCYLQAYDIWKALGNESQLFRVTFNLGFYAFQAKDYKEALKYYHLSVAAAEKYGGKRDLAHVYGTMAESYEALGDYKNAYKYIYRYATLNDSFSREDINSYVLRLDKQFQAEKARQTIQEQELQLKKQQNTTLIILMIAMLVIAGGGVAFAYATFRNRVRQKVDEAKGRFFDNVAHEIRTPLSMIMGPIELLQAGAKDERMQQQLDMAARNTQRLSDLITQMLDISKIDAAKYTLQEHAGNPAIVARLVHQQYNVQAQAKGIALACHCDAEVNVYFDRDALEKVLSNLIGNAVKYTPAGGSAGVELSVRPGNDTVQLSITVWDNGPGIPVAEQQKIFERFYRSGSQQSAGIKGSGIGLALVKELVTLMHGSITVHSAPGKGAVFTVRLNLRPADGAGKPAAATGYDRPVILLAEDDKDILAFNTSMLEAEGYVVIATADGDAASAAIAASLPDLVVTDIMMPGKDGMALLRDLRANELTAHIPVIMLSARAAQDSRTESMVQGAQAYLAKPFSPAELKALVRSQLALLHSYRARYQATISAPAAAIAEPVKTEEELLPAPDPFTQKCHDIILAHLDDAQFSVERLAELMNVNRSHFQRKIKTLTGYSPSELIKTLRLEAAKEMLLKKQGNITETAYATGFTSQSYFTRCFTDHFGYPPSEVHSRV